MSEENNLSQLRDVLFNAYEILITTTSPANLDNLCASLAVYHSLNAISVQPRKIVIATSGRDGTQYSLLHGSDQIVSELSLRDLVIGLSGYKNNSIEAITWHIEGNNLNLIFKGNPKVPMQFDLKKLDPFYAGINFDVVFVVGASKLEDLENMYKQDPGLYTDLPVINISNKSDNTNFGRVNIVDSNVSSTSEIIFQLFNSLQINMPENSLSLLRLGMKVATNNFTNNSEHTESVRDMLLQKGARNIDMQGVQTQSTNSVLPVIPTK